MVSDQNATFLLIGIPWLINFCILLKHYTHSTDTSSSRLLYFLNKIVIAWGITLIAIIAPIFIWNGEDQNSAAAVMTLTNDTYNRVTSALLHSLRYVLPFAAYPLIIFWFKLLVNYRAHEAEGPQSGSNPVLNAKTTANGHIQQRAQARLITFALKGMIMVFVGFDVMQRLGIETDQVLQVGTIFSLGLSWSMRDWLGSLWAGFMIAFTTDLTVGAWISVGYNISTAKSQCLKVFRTGLIFTVCQNRKDTQTDKTDGSFVYIPNSTLMSSGFVVYEQ